MLETNREEVQDALRLILWELPAEFSSAPTDDEPRESFTVVKKGNVRRIHEALWVLQQALLDSNDE